MRDILRDANEELKRVDHLVYVSLKYTRTVDVILNILNRMVDGYAFMMDLLIKKAQDDGQRSTELRLHSRYRWWKLGQSCRKPQPGTGRAGF